MSNQQLSILHINKFHYFRDGASNVYLRTAYLLESKGHSSVFFSMQRPDNLPFCETSEYFMPYVDLNAKDLSIIKKLKISGRFIYSFEAKKRLSMLLDKYAVDIAHLHNIYHQISPSILYELKKRGIPVVMTLHDYKTVCGSYSMLVNGKPCNDCREKKYFMAIKNRCVKDSFVKSIFTAFEMYIHHSIFNIYDNVDIFISPSLFLKNKLEEMGFRRKVVYLPNFIDLKESCTDKKIEESINKEVVRENSVVYFGRLSKEKGLMTLINAAKLLMQKKERLDMKIKIIGEGVIEEELREKVKSEGINNVRFFGFMEGNPLFQELKKNIAVVLPSEWYENNPVSILEAFSIGMPVIGARIGGIPELVKDNVTGLTFESGSPEDLSCKIEYILDNPDKAAEMGKNARKHVEQELNAEKHYQKLMEIYKQVINKK